MNENRFSFSSLNRIFALSLNKISCVSGIKIKFVPLSEDLIINQIVYSAQLALSLTDVEDKLRFGNKNKILSSFILYSAQLALSLDKINCTRECKIKTSFILIFHSFALSLHGN